MTRGLVAGRFLPPHAGHVFLIETAAALCDALTILLRVAPDDAVPAALRQAWLAELFPAARIVTCADEGGEHACLPTPIDLLFDGGGRQAALAAALDARHVVLDPDLATVPVRSAAVRADPLAHWRDLPEPVRPHYARTICLHGPESTGKSTLAPALARHFGTLWLPEYGRTYCEAFGLDLTMDDLLAIGRTHAAMTRAAKRRCESRLILDTDPLMTAAWAEMLFGQSDPWFEDFTETADLYLLLDIDIPWVDDGSRFFGDAARRRRFFDRSREQLDRRGLRYAVIGGSPEQRFDRAVAAIAAAGLA